ncbi:hypothetical protein BKA24_001786 [Microbacterium marinum]|uniref:PD-(D/E)XK nuclease superfamily protein n=1 Tax=Microbacterium marinum TaxID=421115 RepID=A0A7W7BQP3_9MICO|nr:hypothetical protein [Microbacterium marinum]MBB4667077.1 hypothetical protein [Microbacterium marinum]
MRDTIVSDSDIRYLAISMINAETERDRQTQIGASSFSNPCDNCLAAELAGHKRFNEFAERPYLGRALGTLLHNGLEGRQHIAQALHPGAEMEQRVTCAVIPGYGEIPGHFDARLTNKSILDWKGSKRHLMAILEDILQERGQHRVGLEPRWTQAKDTKAYKGGFKFKADEHTTVSFSYVEFQKERQAMAHKHLWYYGQQNLYMRASGAARASIVYIARDGTGFFDNPAFSGYDDPERKHDILVVSFNYDEAYTDALIQRGTDIVAALAGGAEISSFASHEACKFCSGEHEKARRRLDIEWDDLGLPAREVTTKQLRAQELIDQGVDMAPATGIPVIPTLDPVAA